MQWNCLPLVSRACIEVDSKSVHKVAAKLIILALPKKGTMITYQYKRGRGGVIFSRVISKLAFTKKEKSKHKRKMKLEIGCGKKPRKGYLTCDIRDMPNVDYVCTADKLPFSDEQIDEIYSRHVVEHFTLKEFLKVLEEWNRVLKVNGEVYIICPNLLWHLEQILKGGHQSFYSKQSGENDRYWGFGSLFGWQQDAYDIHKFGYYFELMKDILEEFGFAEIEDLTNSGEGLENEPWHLVIRAKKKRKSPNHKEVKLYSHFDVKH